MHPALAHIVGQDNIKTLLSYSINGIRSEKELIQPLLFGEPGLGKTEVARSYGKAVAEELETEFFEYATPSDFRLVVDFDNVAEILSRPSYVLYVDECHEIDTKMVSHAKFVAFVRKALDRQNDGKMIQVADKTFYFNRKKQVLILSTNHPDKVDNAIKSRMNAMTLIPYNMKSLKEITRNILSRNNMECDCDQTLDRLASCGRGTARPIDNLVKDVFTLMNVKIIDNEIAMTALRLKEMFPIGLKPSEVRLLDLCKERILNRLQILSALTDLQGNFSESIAYLMQKQLIDAKSNGFQTSPKGEKYLKYIIREGFTWE